jgi:hypothetical protein
LNREAAAWYPAAHGYDRKMRPVSLGPQTSEADTSPTPFVAAVAVEFPRYQVDQQEALWGLTGFGGPQFDRFAASAGVQ